MLYVDHEFEGMIDNGKTYKFTPGSYWLKVDNDRRVIAEETRTGDTTIVGYVNFVSFLRDDPKRTVEFFTVHKKNPIWFAVGLLLVFTAGAVTGCSMQINQCNNCIQQNTQQNNPPQGGGGGQQGGGSGGGGG